MGVDGTWKVVVRTPMGAQDATLNFTTAGDTLTGTLSNSSGTVPIQDGKVQGNSVSWKAHLSAPFPMTLDCAGTVDGDSISGTVNTSFGASPFSGQRVQSDSANSLGGAAKTTGATKSADPAKSWDAPKSTGTEKSSDSGKSTGGKKSP